MTLLREQGSKAKEHGRKVNCQGTTVREGQEEPRLRAKKLKRRVKGQTSQESQGSGVTGKEFRGKFKDQGSAKTIRNSRVGQGLGVKGKQTQRRVKDQGSTVNSKGTSSIRGQGQRNSKKRSRIRGQR